MNSNVKYSTDGFVKAVEAALTHYQEPDWLSTHSPLAAPYFLGQSLLTNDAPSTIHAHGRALQTALHTAAADLNAEEQELLHVAYFDRNPSLDNIGLALALHMSERTFYRAKIRTVQVLAEKLDQLVMPPLRPETPVAHVMIGRDHQLVSSLATLAQGHSVYLAGASGTGKTTLAAAITQEWDQQQRQHFMNVAEPQTWTFWYTLRPGFNDQLANFVFTLSYFLRKLGASATWRQLVADEGKIKLAQIIGLLRHDLQTRKGPPLLLCIDEVDLLESEQLAHIQIIHLLEELKQMTPLLLIGQHAIIEATAFITLAGFNSAEVRAYLHHVGITHLDQPTQQLLAARTNGNPALLSLLNTLNQLGGNIEEGLKALENAPAIEALYLRIWRRLTDPEKRLLLQLVVFRSPAPRDAWVAERATLQRLEACGLVHEDREGAVALLPYIRKIGYSRTAVELKPLLHHQAALIREERNHILSAMHHYIAAQRPEPAIWLWYSHRSVEIERGQGASALQLLQNISSAALTNIADCNALLAARGELFKLLGQPDEAATELAQVALPAQGTFAAYVQQLQAGVMEAQGQTEQALVRYRSALDALTGSPLQREVTIRTRIGFLHEFNFQDRASARREALLARIKAEGFHGNLEEMAGNYQAARERYQTACVIAQQLDQPHNAALSQVFSQLGVLTLREGQVTEAISLIEQAIHHDQQRGDTVGPLYDMLNLAYAYTVAKDYMKAFEVAADGLQIAQRLGLSYLVAGLACGAGEAACGLQRFTEAEAYGQLSLAQEEGYFRCWGLALLGVVHSHYMDYTKAEMLLDEAIQSAKEAEDQYGEAHCWHMLAEARRRAGERAGAMVALLRAVALYQALKLEYKLNELAEQRQAWAAEEADC